jgi:hypothetical protein
MNIDILRNILRKKLTFDHTFHDIELGGLLKEKRIRLNRTQDEVSRGICSVSYLSKLENAQIEPNHYVIKELALKLNLDPNISSFHEEKMTLIDDIISAHLSNNISRIMEIRSSILKYDSLAKLHILIIDIILENEITESKFDYHVKLSNTYNQYELIALIYFISFYYFKKRHYFTAYSYLSLIIDSQNNSSTLTLLKNNLNHVISLYLDHFFPVIIDQQSTIFQQFSYSIYFKLLKFKSINTSEMTFISYEKTTINRYIKFLISNDQNLKYENIDSIDVDPVTDSFILKKSINLDDYIPKSELQIKTFGLINLQTDQEIKKKIRDDILPFLLFRGYMVYAELYKEWIVDICIETARYKEAISYINKIKKRRITSL